MLANPSSAPALAKPSDTSPTHSTPASPTVPEAVRLLEPTVRDVIAQMKHLQTHNDPKPVLPTKIVSGDKVIFTKTMLDTGNLFRPAISKELYLSLPPEDQVLTTGSLLVDRVPTADEREAGLTVLGELARPLKVFLWKCKQSFSITPVVLDGLAMPFNLSYDFQKRNGLSVDPPSSTVRIRGQRYALPYSRPARQVGLHLLGDHTVPPNSQKYVWAQLASPPGHANPDPSMIAHMREHGCLVRGSERLQRVHKLCTWREVAHRPTEDGRIKVGFINTKSRPVTVKKGTLYGTAEAFQEADTTTYRDRLCLLDAGQMGSSVQMDVDGQLRPSAPPSGKATSPSWLEGPTTEQNQRLRIDHIRKYLQASQWEAVKDPKDRVRAIGLILKYWGVFSWTGEYGRTNLVQHHIPLKPDARPVRIPFRPVNPNLETSLHDQIKDWLAKDVIEPSYSDWNAPMVAVLKPSGKVRWCVDYRALNERTVRDLHPIGDIHDSLARLAGSCVYSTIDSHGAFHAVPIEAKSKPYTAFSTPFGHYQFKYMPFGLANAPSCYARLVRRVLDGVSWKVALPYLDDTLVHSKDLEEHFAHLETVLSAFIKAGIKLGPEKCFLFRHSVKYLGHRISKEGIATDPEYIKAVTEWPVPDTRKKVRVFLGKAGYYKKFIPNYQGKSRRLTEKLQKDELPDNATFEVDENYIADFENLKKALSSTPILAFPDFYSNEPFILDTDFSQEMGTIGAVLSQRQNGQERPILYGSYKLNSAQKNYSTNKGELHAILTFVTKYKYYLLGRPFILRTDHKAFTSIKNMESPQGMVMRWLDTLSNYSFTVVHRPGAKHGNADALSRIDHAEEDPDGNFGDQGIVAGLMSAEEPTLCPMDENLLAGITALNHTFPITQVEDWLEQQRTDPDLGPIHRLMDENREPTDQLIRDSSREGALFLQHFREYFRDRHGLLRWERPQPTGPPGEKPRQVILIPRGLREQIMMAVHTHWGHRGREETVRRASRHFYWPNMSETARAVKNVCLTCQERDGPPKPQKELLVPASAAYPFQRLCVDFVGPLKSSTKGHRYILTVLDTYSRWLEAFPTRTCSAEIVAHILQKDIFPRYGLPERIHSDRGTHFTAEVVQRLARELKIVWELGPAYSPKSNNVERHHRTLNGLIRRLATDPRKWAEVLPVALFIHRTSVCRVTGMAPYSLLFGRDCNTTLDLLFRDPHEALEKGQEDPQSMRTRILDAAEWARKNVSKAVARARLGYRGLRNKYKEGDRVWLFTPALRPGHSKKSNVYWTGPWTIVKEVNPLVFEIKPHPVWARAKNEVVTIDRLKPYRSHEADDDGLHSHPPPVDADLSCLGDEYLQNFEVNENPTVADADADEEPGLVGPAAPPPERPEAASPLPRTRTPVRISPRTRTAEHLRSPGFPDGSMVEDGPSPPKMARSPPLLLSPPGEDVRRIPVPKAPGRRRRTQTELLLAESCNNNLLTPSKRPEGYHLRSHQAKQAPITEEAEEGEEEETGDRSDDDGDLVEPGPPEGVDIMDLSDDPPEPLDAALEAEIDPIGISFLAYLHSLIAAQPDSEL